MNLNYYRYIKYLHKLLYITVEVIVFKRNTLKCGIYDRKNNK